MAAPFCDQIQRRDALILGHDLPECVAWPDYCGANCRQCRLSRAADFATEPFRGFNHNVKKQPPSSCRNLPFLAFEFRNCGDNAGARLRADACAIVEHAINRRGAEPRLTGNFFDREAMRHLMYF